MPPFYAPTDGKGPTVSSVVDEIQCEIAEAAAKPENNVQLFGLAPFSDWTAAVALTLTVDDTAGTASGGLPLSYITPLKPATYTWAFNANPILYQTRTRTYVQNYTLNIANTKGETCESLQRQNHGFNLEGDLGLREQIYLGLHSFGSSQSTNIYQPASGGKATDNFGATANFHVYLGITNIGPTWTIRTFKGPSAGVGYSRDDLHQVVITFAPTMAIVPIPPVRPKPKEIGKEAPLFEQKRFNAELKAYQESVVAHEAALRHNARAAAVNASAIDSARQANQTLQLNQAIQNLGQILANPANP